MAAKNEMPQQAIEIQPLPAETIQVPIIGMSPLIVHAWDEKAKLMVPKAKGDGSQKPKNVTRDPHAEFVAGQYRLKGGGHGFPAAGFKAAIVSGARFFGKPMTMTLVKQSVFVHGEIGSDGRHMVEILFDGDEPSMRSDYVRINRGGSILRYRPEYWPWEAYLSITYVQSAFTRSTILTLIDAGGLGAGVGEWRPDFGQFKVDTTRDVEVLA